MKKLHALHLLVVIVLSATLINVSIFGNATMAAFFFYVISAAVVISFAGVCFIKSNQLLSGINYLPLLFFFLLVLWHFVQTGFLSLTVISTVQIFITVNFFILLAFVLFFKMETIRVQAVFKIIAVMALFEAIVCIMQSFDWINSQNEYLPISGTWVNPNVTAMFLAVSVPAIIYNIVSPSAPHKKIYLPILLLVVVAIISLKCRTAILGALAAVLFFLSSYYNVRAFIKNKFSPAKQFFLLTATVIIIIPAGFYFYKAKEASADGRQLIWKISANMITQNTLAGVGYGMFEHDYNLQQANYFATNTATTKEIDNASFTHMTYNEFLQNAVEGGLIGLILFAAFLLSLLVPLKRLSKLSAEATVALSGIISFIIMSFINFTVQATPVMVIVMVYTAIICTQQQFGKQTSQMPVWLKPVLSLLLIIAGVAVFFSQISKATAFAKINNAAKLISKNDNTEALEILLPLKDKMQSESFYSITLGKALFNQRKYRRALIQYQYASESSSSPSLLSQISNCRFRLKQYDSALAILQTASNMLPNRLTPKYYMMKMYLQVNDTANAYKMASALIAMKPKGISKNAAQFKKEAGEVLSRQTEKATNSNQSSIINNE